MSAEEHAVPKPLIRLSVPLPPEIDAAANALTRRAKRRPWLTWGLMALLGLVFLAQRISEAVYGVDLVLLLGAKVNSWIREGEWWRLFTAMFIHVDLLHLAVNLYALHVFLKALERHLDRLGLLMMYLLGGVAGSVVSLLWNPDPSVGASGAIFACLGALVVFLLFSQRVVDVSDSLQATLRVLVINLLYGWLSTRIDWQAHLGGMVAGALFAWVASWRLDEYNAQAYVLDPTPEQPTRYTLEPVQVLYIVDSRSRVVLAALVVGLGLAMLLLFWALGVPFFG